MVYMAGDNSLEPFVSTTINAMEAVPASPWVTVAVQEDTKTLPVKGSATCKRIVIQHDTDAINITSPTVTDLGEINTSSTTAVQNFVAWATGTYAADRYVLILWDHGGQWIGWNQDDTTNPNSIINFQQLKTMFGNIQGQFQTATGHSKFDIIGFDACLMAGLEIDQLLASYADYRIASCEPEFAKIGQSGLWDYGAWLAVLVGNPGMSVPAVGQSICDTFIARENSYLIGNQTLSVANLANTSTLVSAVDVFAQWLINRLPTELVPTIARERRESLEYNVLDPSTPGVFIDLRDFASRLAVSSSSSNLRAAAAAVVAALDSEIVYKAHGALEVGYGGVSIYFPNDTSDPGYANVDLAITTNWDNCVSQYQTALGADSTPPGVTINSPATGTSVSPASPISVNFTVTGADLYDISARFSTQISPTSWQILGEIDFGILPQGTYAFTWNAKPFVIWDGVAPFSDFLSCFTAQPGSTLYTTTMHWVQANVDVVLLTDLNWNAGTGSILGAYILTPAGAVISAPIGPGDSLRIQYPILDITTGTITYQLSAVTLTVPPGGLFGLSTYLQRLSFASGSNHDLDIFGEDYAGNFGVDYKTYHVP